MRLLPRTARGTWLLAALAWLAVCALAWAVLPPWPRAVWAVSGETEVIGFLPGTRTLVTLTAGPRSSLGARETPTGSLCFWDADSGRSRSWFTRADPLPLVTPSPDGRWVLVGHGSEDASRLRAYDVATGSIAADIPFRVPAYAPDAR